MENTKEKKHYKVFELPLKNKTLAVIDLAWWIFHNNLERLVKTSLIHQYDLSDVYRINNKLEQPVICELVKVINTYAKLKEEAKEEYVIGISLRSFGMCDKLLFNYIAEHVKPTANWFFYDIDPAIFEMMKNSFQINDTIKPHIKIAPRKKAVAVIANDTAKEDPFNFTAHISACEKCITSALSTVVKSIMQQNSDGYQLLSSSSVYASHYVNVKELFQKPEDFALVLYYLTRLVEKKDLKYDALIATSKNGAILASLLGDLVDAEVVYCISIGPQFSIPADWLDQRIEQGKRYLHVSDFICLGTEVKLINAILASRRSTLIGGVGIASFIPVGKRNPDLKSPLANYECLINVMGNTKEFDIKFKKTGGKK